MTSSDEWPFPQRRKPKIDDPDYLGSKGLTLALQKVITTRLVGMRELDILDVGCGQKPFYPFLRNHCRRYVGTDMVATGHLVDIVAQAESLAVPSDSFDLVLELSVLEHVDDPHKAVAELHRVLRRGGMVFASTHGFFPWHPSPQDHWRWTQTGLRLLFTRHGHFADVEIFPTRGTVSGVFFLLAHYLYRYCSIKRWRRPFRGPLTTTANLLGEVLDRATPSLHDMDTPVTALPEFFVVARKE